MRPAVSLSKLRQFLAQKLPDYMLPSAFVELEAMPLTPNGKIDRRALPASDSSTRSLEEEFIAPRTPTEEILATIWAEVLGVQQVGIQDNFFELGGHSLLATQVISQIRETFSVELSLPQLFASPTLAGLAESMELARHTSPSFQLPAVEPIPRDTELPLSFAQERLWFLCQLEGSSATYSIPAAIKLGGLLNVAALESALQEILRRHEVLRTKLQNNPCFEEILKQVRQVALDAYSYQDVPFEKIVDALQPERNLSHSTLFQVMFVLQNAPMRKLELPGLSLTPMEGESAIAKFDLTLSLEETEQGLKGVWEYNSDLFDATTIERMSRHFQTLLEGIVANPQERVGQLPMLTEVERQRLLVEWNETQTDYPKDKCIHQLFEEQVEQTPDAVAVIYEDQQLTYRELNDHANQLAHYLQQFGVEQEVLVGLYLERSLNRIVGLLAILKAGGVYLPLDPAYPQERVTFMLEDSQASVIVTQSSLIANLQKDKAKIINLDRNSQEIETQAKCNPQSLIAQDNLAYVIYTSGSTGKPKGVLIEHRAISGHCQTIVEHFQLTQCDRILQFASVGFDVSLEQILPTLMVGATLILSETKFLTGLDFNQKLQELGLTVVNLTPAYWNQWLQSLEDNPSAIFLDQLRLVICGGEEISPESLKLWQKSPMRSVRLLNAYGPTETTITAMTFEVFQESSLSAIPIGRPLKNRKVYILDSSLQPVPISVPGELYISGDGLARG